MERITVNRDALLNFMDDVDELAEYIEELVNFAYKAGYCNALTEKEISE